MKLLSLALCAVPLIAACTDPQLPDDPGAAAEPGGTSADPGDPAGPAASDDGVRIVTEEGAFGRIRVQTPDGPMLLSYQVVNGRAVHEEDMDLGPVELLRARGGAARLGERWPNGHAHFAFHEDFTGSVCKTNLVDCVNVRTRVRDTLAAMEDKLPLSFTEVSIDDAGDHDTIVFRFVSGQETPGHSSHTGMDGGTQYVSFRPGHASDSAPPYPYYNLEPTGGTVRHEVLHAMGLWHEQSRNDRDEFVDVQYGCIEGGDGNGNYDIKDESADLGPYDYRSIMHYRDTAQCIPPFIPELDPDGDGCVCKTLVPKFGAGFGGDGVPRGGFSVEDTNTVYRMYTRPRGTNTAGDSFGEAIAIGDFDGDGYDDMAVGIPGEDGVTGTFPNFEILPNAGVVSLWKGTSAGPVLWRTFNAASFSGQSITANGKFGAALAAYDLNADGISDLAIGAPGAVGGAGAVQVWRGTTQTGLVEHRVLTQALTAVDDDEAGDRFGEALAAGPITGLVRAHDSCDQKPDADHPVEALVVGAPGDRVSLLLGTTSRRGSVFLYQETRPSCSTSSTLNAPTELAHGFGHAGGAAGDDFGAALAVGDLDGDGRADLAVGAPLFNGGAGKVYLYQGRLPPENPFAWSAMVLAAGEAVPSAATRFGAAIAIGKLLPVTGRQLVVGAPGGAGKVTVFTGGFSPAASVNITHAAPASGDDFGAALAIGDVDRSATGDDLAIGAPGDDSGAGSVLLVRGGAAGLPTRTAVTQLLPLGDRAAGDRFGAALAIGSLDGGDGRTNTAQVGTVRLDLAVGAPGEGPDNFPYADDTKGGAVDLLRGRSGTTVGAWLQRHQENSGRLSDP